MDENVVERRDAAMLAGMYLAQFNEDGLDMLGFKTLKEAYNVFAYALGLPTSSIKNYRDEFDPLFPNGRKGWRNRPVREGRLAIYDKYKGLDLKSFAGLLMSLTGDDNLVRNEARTIDEEGESGFAKRMITGRAAEKYFESVWPCLAEFSGYEKRDTTLDGCGYDFRLSSPEGGPFLAVEVKGLDGPSGAVSMTTKEYAVASALTDRFFLFVVKDFRKKPFHEVFRNPLVGVLDFTRQERRVIQVSWVTNV